MTCSADARVTLPRYTSRYPLTSPSPTSVTPREGRARTGRTIDRIDITTENTTPEDINKFIKASEDLHKLNHRIREIQLNTEHSTSNDDTPYFSTTNTPLRSTSQIFFETLTNKLETLHTTSLHNNTEFKKFVYKPDTCPREFINKVEEYAEAKNIPTEKLYTHFRHALGPTLEWYRQNKKTLNNWNSFKIKFINDFQIFDQDFKIKQKIDNRKQKNYERIIFFIADMESMFAKLTEPLSDTQKIQAIRRGLLPKYTSRLLPENVTSLEKLIEACKWFENCDIAKYAFPTNTEINTQ
ncbi:hypothetical protein NE865_00572 [Phthorimaea operculella]|nr:hypothetical protein NE865_00572 [Phthorimaea operculella]